MILDLHIEKNLLALKIGSRNSDFYLCLNSGGLSDIVKQVVKSYTNIYEVNISHLYIYIYYIYTNFQQLVYMYSVHNYNMFQVL